MSVRSPEQREYMKILADMKRLGLKIDDMPEDVARSTLFLYQHFLNEEGRKRRKDEK